MNKAIILLGGVGNRFASKTPKQFLLVYDYPLFYYSYKAFFDCPLIDSIIFVCHPSYIDYLHDFVDKYKLKKVEKIISGGKTRQESTYNALKEGSFNNDDIVLIHDGARPLIETKIIKENVEDCKKYHSAVTAYQVKDSFIYKENDIKYLNRDFLFQIQTPQTFYYKDIFFAHDKHKFESFNDDASLYLLEFGDYHILKNDNINLKVTTKEDLLLVSYILKERKK